MFPSNLVLAERLWERRYPQRTAPDRRKKDANPVLIFSPRVCKESVNSNQSRLDVQMDSWAYHSTETIQALTRVNKENRAQEYWYIPDFDT